jgi:hypothetical protein
MTARFDIFRVEMDGRLYRLGTAESIEDAKKRVQVFAVNSKRGFCAIDQTTGETVILKSEEIQEAS